MKPRLALVTGCTRGIGAAIVEQLKAKNIEVWGTGSTTEDPGTVDRYITANFTDMREVNSLLRDIQQVDIDILVNNAGINEVANFADITNQSFNKHQQVNVFVPFKLMQTVAVSMQRNNWGRIINLGSIWSQVGRTGRASYASNKHALVGLTQCFAAEYSRYNVLANVVSPGIIDTELTRRNLNETQLETLLAHIPQGRLGTVEEVARYIVWLSTENTFITGQNLIIDGGFTSV